MLGLRIRRIWQGAPVRSGLWDIWLNAVVMHGRSYRTIKQLTSKSRLEHWHWPGISTYIYQSLMSVGFIDLLGRNR